MPIATAFPRRALLAAMVAVIACSSGEDDDNGNPPPGPVDLELEFVGSAEQPTTLTAAPGDARLFITEKRGVIRIYANGAFLATPFLDISALVGTDGEQGLLGLAFDPDYAANGRFFVSYSNLAGDNVLASYSVSGNPDIATPGSGLVRLTVPQPQDNHNGGHIVFGPDGYLYLGRGDGGGGGDPNGYGQSRNELLGSILRLDVSGATSYAVPSTNPFVGEAGVRAEIWSYGLRNPWRFSFDRATDDLYVADVGQDLWEEVSVVTAADGAGRGTNFGWNVMEGTHCFEPATGCSTAGLTLPVLDYDHDEGCSVTGGFVYRGAAIPDLQGTYLYSDFCGGWIRTFRFAGGQATEAGDAGIEVGSAVLSIGEDAAGELYVLALSAIYRIVEQTP
jgi:glucose/arabinose dehydrogenase